MTLQDEKINLRGIVRFSLESPGKWYTNGSVKLSSLKTRLFVKEDELITRNVLVQFSKILIQQQCLL